MPFKSSWDLIFSYIIFVFNFYSDLTFGQFVSQVVQDPKDIVLQLFIVPEHASNDMIGPSYSRSATLNDSGRTSEPLVSDPCKYIQ